MFLFFLGTEHSVAGLSVLPSSSALFLYPRFYMLFKITAMITKISFREVYFSVTLRNTLISKRCSEHMKIQVLCLKWNIFRNCLILNIFWCCFRIWNYYYYSQSNIFVPIETEGLVQIDEGKNPGLKIVQTLSTKVLNVLIRIFVGKNKEFNITGTYSTYYFLFYILGKKKRTVLQKQINILVREKSSL